MNKAILKELAAKLKVAKANIDKYKVAAVVLALLVAVPVCGGVMAFYSNVSTLVTYAPAGLLLLVPGVLCPAYAVYKGVLLMREVAVALDDLEEAVFEDENEEEEV